MGRRSSMVVGAAALVVALGAALSACGKDEFEDRTGTITIDGRSEQYEIDSCGLDDETLFVVGRSEGGSVLQAVVGLPDDDLEGVLDVEGVLESTGVTVDATDTGAVRYAAFGEEAWARRGEPGSPPGTIESARARGSRIQLSASAVPVDDRDAPTPDATPVELRMDVRCDAEEGEVPTTGG